MKLTGKTFWHNIALSCAVLFLVMGYLLFLMPSLYVQYQDQRSLNQVKEAHWAFLSQEEPAPPTADAPAAVFSVTIPEKGYELSFMSPYVRGTVTIPEGRLRNALDLLRDRAGDPENWAEQMTESEKLWHQLEQELSTAAKEYIRDWKLDIILTEAPSSKEGTMRWGVLGKSSIYLVSQGSDGQTGYDAYVLMTRREGRLFLSMMNTVTPSIRDIQPVILQSFPMIGAVVFLLVLASSQWFSKNIVGRITRMEQHVAWASEQPISKVTPLPQQGKDEIGRLSVELNHLYRRL